MTNREKWMPEVISDRLIENSICYKYIDIEAGFGNCPKCPISLRALCKKRFVSNALSDLEYMKAVSKWLDEEVEETDSTAGTIFEKENALKLIDCLEATTDTLRREIVMSDAIMSIGKETAND